MVQAQNFSVVPLGLGLRFERSETQELTSRQSFHLALIYDNERFSMEISRDQFNSKTAEGNVSIKREYQDYLAWANYQLLGTDLIRFYLGGGFGFYQEQIITRVASFETDSSTQQEFFSGGGAEVRWHLSRPEVLVSTGARMLYSQSFDPELQPHLFLRLGWRF
jgi:hypothetical protein